MAAPTFEVGQHVEVVRAISETERCLIGRRFRVFRMDATHGYAVCADEWGGGDTWWLHPEALQVIVEPTCAPG